MKIQRLFIAVSIMATSQLFAEEPPSPADVANTASNLWMSSNLTGLAEYTTNLYASYPNYVPAIILSAFHDGIFKGDLSAMTTKQYRVQEFVNFAPSNYTEEFTDLLAELRSETDREINLHRKMGISESQLRSNASPAAVRAVGDIMPPHIFLLYYSPATNLTEKQNNENEVQQGGPGYPPQGVGSPDP